MPHPRAIRPLLNFKTQSDRLGFVLPSLAVCRRRLRLLLGRCGVAGATLREDAVC